jgi:glycosyltransferase involved in cell wall biosynthesis
MTTQTGTNHHERGLELASAGKYQEGFNCIREHLRTAPQDVQALNDAGAILHCLGRTEDALGYLTKAQNLKSDSAEIIWNLVEAYLACGRAAEAISLFDSMDGMGILNIDVLNRAATTLIDQGRKGPAIEVLLRSCRLWPEQQVVQPMLDVIRSKRPRIALFRNRDGEDGVLADLCDFVRERFPMEDYEDHHPGGVADLMRRCEIAWFDGGGDLLAEASALGTRVRIVASLRRSDVRDRWAKDVRWENVSILAQIGGVAVEEALMPQVPDIRNRTRLTVVPHGVNLERYALRRRERGKHLACIGNLTAEANPAFLIQCLQKLHYIDPAYHLSFAGRFESPVLEQYLRHMVRTLNLTDVVTFEPSAGELNHWLSDKHFIVAGGIDDQQIEALLAGMACGLKPVVHHFPGADRLFPPRHLFTIAERFCEQVLAGEYEPQQYRRFVEQRYPLQEQFNGINGILQQIETEIESRQEGAARETSCEAREGQQRDDRRLSAR